MNPDNFTPGIHAYLTAEQAFLAEHLTSEQHVVEVGCGAGNNLVWLAPHVRHLRGIDYAWQMVAVSRQRTQHFPNVSVLHGDAQHLSANLQPPVDIIFMAWNTFGNFNAQEQAKILASLPALGHPDMLISVYQEHEKAMRERLAYYAHLGFSVLAQTSEQMTLQAESETITLYTYNLDHYQKLFAQADYRMTTHPLADIGLGIHARYDARPE